MSQSHNDKKALPSNVTKTRNGRFGVRIQWNKNGHTIITGVQGGNIGINVVEFNYTIKTST